MFSSCNKLVEKIAMKQWELTAGRKVDLAGKVKKMWGKK